MVGWVVCSFIFYFAFLLQFLYCIATCSMYYVGYLFFCQHSIWPKSSYLMSVMCIRESVIPLNVNLRMANWVTVQKLALEVNKDQQSAIHIYQTYLPNLFIPYQPPPVRCSSYFVRL